MAPGFDYAPPQAEVAADSIEDFEGYKSSPERQQELWRAIREARARTEERARFGRERRLARELRRNQPPTAGELAEDLGPAPAPGETIERVLPRPVTTSPGQRMLMAQAAQAEILGATGALGRTAGIIEGRRQETYGDLMRRAAEQARLAQSRRDYERGAHLEAIGGLGAAAAEARRAEMAADALREERAARAEQRALQERQFGLQEMMVKAKIEEMGRQPTAQELADIQADAAQAQRDHDLIMADTRMAHERKQAEIARNLQQYGIDAQTAQAEAEREMRRSQFEAEAPMRQEAGAQAKLQTQLMQEQLNQLAAKGIKPSAQAQARLGQMLADPTIQSDPEAVRAIMAAFTEAQAAAQANQWGQEAMDAAALAAAESTAIDHGIGGLAGGARRTLGEFWQTIGGLAGLTDPRAGAVITAAGKEMYAGGDPARAIERELRGRTSTGG